MLVYVLKRVGLALVTLVLLSMIVFTPAKCCPVIRDGSSSGPCRPQAVVALDRKLGVDRPLVTQYWSWVTGFCAAISGTSYQFQAPVSSFLCQAPCTL